MTADLHRKYRRVVGRPVTVTLEHAVDPAKIDHVWIALDAGGHGRFRAVVNTLSLRNQAVGADARVRAGIVRETYESDPPLGVFEAAGLDYADIEGRHNVFYEHLERRDLELFIMQKADTAAFIEVWGEVYSRDHTGIHQIHSRRASCAVSEDIRGRDGALRCYYGETRTTQLLLFKFCGQA